MPFNAGERCLEVEGLEVTIRGNKLLDGVTFRHCGGRVYVILGRNGSGKTTLARAIVGLVSPDRGRILYDGRDYTREPPWVRRFAFAPTPFPLIENKTVRQTLESIAKIAGSRDPEREVSEIARRYEITGLLDRLPHQLSQGERQRVGVAAIVLAKPRVAVFDEPLAHLSRKWAIVVSTEIEKLAREEQIPVITTTPRLEDAMLFGSDTAVGVLHRGKIVASGAIGELISSPPSMDVVTGLDYYVSNIVDLKSDSVLVEHVARFCNNSARYAWISPDLLEVSEDGGLEGSLEKLVPEPGAMIAYVNVGGVTLATRAFDSRHLKPGDRVRLSLRGAICFNENGGLER